MAYFIIKSKVEVMTEVILPFFKKAMEIDTEDIITILPDKKYGVLEIGGWRCVIDKFQDIIDEHHNDIAVLINDGNEYLEHGANDEVNLHWNINVDYGTDKKEETNKNVF